MPLKDTATATALVVISWHVGHVLKKQCYDGTRYLQRMLPLSHRAPASEPPRKTRHPDPA
jgi:cytochrome b561